MGTIYPTISQINRADSLVALYIANLADEESASSEPLTTTTYNRQYAGVITPRGEQIICINSMCRWLDYWSHTWAQVVGGGDCYYQIQVNLTKSQCDQLFINADK